MVFVGVLYLMFEDFVLSDFSWARKRPIDQAAPVVGRFLAGIQIGLILLSMFVTRSSALSLQAKQGLPSGNQAVGWIVLGMLAILVEDRRTDPKLTTLKSDRCSCRWHIGCNQTAITCTASWSSF